MEALLEFISSYVSYWPLAVFLLLLLAGLNLPISEDALIILSAAMVHQNPKLLLPTYVALYIGIFFSDIMVYTMGRLLSKGFLQFQFLKKKLTPEKLEWVSTNLEKHGLFTFITCRFIPFGVRNALFLCSGFVGLNPGKFLLFDSIAALISSSTLFFLVYFIGQAAKKGLEVIGIILFVILVLALIIFFIRHKNKNNKIKKESDYEADKESDNKSDLEK